MPIVWTSGLEDQGWTMLGPSPIVNGLALLEIEIVEPPLGIVVTRERLTVCSVRESLSVCTVTEA